MYTLTDTFVLILLIFAVFKIIYIIAASRADTDYILIRHVPRYNTVEMNNTDRV